MKVYYSFRKSVYQRGPLLPFLSLRMDFCWYHHSNFFVRLWVFGHMSQPCEERRKGPRIDFWLRPKTSSISSPHCSRTALWLAACRSAADCSLLLLTACLYMSCRKDVCLKVLLVVPPTFVSYKATAMTALFWGLQPKIFIALWFIFHSPIVVRLHGLNHSYFIFEKIDRSFYSLS